MREREKECVREKGLREGEKQIYARSETEKKKKGEDILDGEDTLDETFVALRLSAIVGEAVLSGTEHGGHAGRVELQGVE
jgi:hypothetical protein